MCYEFTDSWEQISKKLLPAEWKFYSALNNEEISHRDYMHAPKVWNKSKKKDLGECQDLYNAIDVYFCWKRFLSYSWKCAPKVIGTELELLTDINMILDYENSIRRVMTTAIFHFVEAINEYMHDYDESNKSSHIIHLDFNNQYEWTLLEPLPYAGFSMLK